MTSTITRWSLLFLITLLVGCAASKGPDKTALRQNKPRSIVVLPPLNNSPDVRASYSFMSTVTFPLSELGYYVFPVALVDQTFKENGLPDPGEMHQVPLKKLAEIFGADAALYITVDRYGAEYQILNSSIVVAARAKLIDTRSGDLLWEGEASASSSESNSGNSGGLLDMLIVSLIQQVINSAGNQGYAVARMTSARLLSLKPGGLLYGPRSPLFGTD
jgi:hypothetical protein